MTISRTISMNEAAELVTPPLAAETDNNYRRGVIEGVAALSPEADFQAGIPANIRELATGSSDQDSVDLAYDEDALTVTGTGSVDLSDAAIMLVVIDDVLASTVLTTDFTVTEGVITLADVSSVDEGVLSAVVVVDTTGNVIVEWSGTGPTIVAP